MTKQERDKLPEVSELQLERLALGELAAHEADEVRSLLERRGEQARLEQLQRSNLEVLFAHPPAAMVAAIEARAGKTSRRSRPARSLLLVGMPTALAASLILLLVDERPSEPVIESPTPPVVSERGIMEEPAQPTDSSAPHRAPQPEPTPEMPVPEKHAPAQPSPTRHAGQTTSQRDASTEDIRVKGGRPRLIVYRQEASGVERLRDGSEARPADLILVSYLAADQPHGVIASLDGTGTVVLHFPTEAGASTRLQQGKPVPLANAYELDDAPHFERFFFVTSQQPIDVEDVLAAARKLGADPKTARTGPLKLALEHEQTSFVLEKVTR